MSCMKAPPPSDKPDPRWAVSFVFCTGKDRLCTGPKLISVRIGIEVKTFFEPVRIVIGGVHAKSSDPVGCRQSGQRLEDDGFECFQLARTRPPGATRAG